MSNAWVEAIERAARAIEKPTEDELDETLRKADLDRWAGTWPEGDE